MVIPSTPRTRPCSVERVFPRSYEVLSVRTPPPLIALAESRAFGYRFRHEWFGPLITADRGFHPDPPGSKASECWIFCRHSTHELPVPTCPLSIVRAFGHRSRLGPYLFAPPFRLWSASLALPTHGLLLPSADFCPAVRRPSRPAQSPGDDTGQISRGKLNRLQCTTAGSTLRAVDGYGLRGTSPRSSGACRLVSGSCSSARTFASRFLQTPPRGDSPCASLNPSPPSGWVEEFHLRAIEHAPAHDENRSRGNWWQDEGSRE